MEDCDDQVLSLELIIERLRDLAEQAAELSKQIIGPDERAEDEQTLNT